MTMLGVDVVACRVNQTSDVDQTIQIALFRWPDVCLCIACTVDCAPLSLSCLPAVNQLPCEWTTHRKKKYSSSYLSRKHSFDKSIRNFKLLKQLLGPPSSTSVSSSSATSSSSLSAGPSKQHNMLVPRATRKQTPTVTHQFQQSLQQLMDTLSHANPFFVRCIKSNADKMPNHFDDKLVLQQLRYTGMLETVRIRQSGYSVRLTFDEFIQHYRILLPKGLLSSKMDVKDFLLGMNLQPNMYQIGNTKVFMRESEKLVLDERLHEEILRRIIYLQRWVSGSTMGRSQSLSS